MKNKTLFLISLLTLFISHLFAQQKVVKLYDSARVYFDKKDFKKAFYFYDTFYSDTANGQSNYDTFYAAIAACNSNNPSKASYYLRRSGEIGYDYSNYEHFAKNPDGKCLTLLPEWKPFITRFKFLADSAEAALARAKAALQAIVNQNILHSKLSDPVFLKGLPLKDPAVLTKELKAFNKYPVPAKKGVWTTYNMQVNDTVTVPYLLYIPAHYDPAKKTPLYIYLHGAVRGRTNFTPAVAVIDGNEIKLMDKAMAQNALIIFPLAKKDFNWLYHQAAFETILKEIAAVKTLYNVDDNKVFIGGHSNGGQGAFWFASHQPTVFAGFFGYNYFPISYNGNTILENLNNKKPFYGFLGAQDTTFPLKNILTITSLVNFPNWQNIILNGNHGLPFDQPDAVNIVFDKLVAESRNVFPNTVRWETDNVLNGRNAWIAISKLDTMAEKASWQKTFNAFIEQNGKEVQINFNRNKSGAVIAEAVGNTIYVKSSRVKELTFYISAEMFDLSKPIKIYVNDRLLYNKVVFQDSKIITDEFIKTKDRAFIVANKIVLSL